MHPAPSRSGSNMAMIFLIVVIALAALLMYCAARFLPQPINWIAVVIILICAVLFLFSGSVELD